MIVTNYLWTILLLCTDLWFTYRAEQWINDKDKIFRAPKWKFIRALEESDKKLLSGFCQSLQRTRSTLLLLLLSFWKALGHCLRLWHCYEQNKEVQLLSEFLWTYCWSSVTCTFAGRGNCISDFCTSIFNWCAKCTQLCQFLRKSVIAWFVFKHTLFTGYTTGLWCCHCVFKEPDVMVFWPEGGVGGIGFLDSSHSQRHAH